MSRGDLEAPFPLFTDELNSAERLACTAEFKRDLVKRAEGALTAEDVRKLLGHKTVQAVHKGVTSRRLFCVDDNGRKLFPAFQFDGAAPAPRHGRRTCGDANH